MSVGPTELIILFIIGVVFLVPLIGGIDALTKPDAVWQSAGENKLLWGLGQLLGAFLCGIVGLVFAIIYWTTIRPRVLGAA